MIPEDVTNNYVTWMNDIEINRFMETRFRKHSKENVAEFVNKMRIQNNILFLAITLNTNNMHIGNKKLEVRPEHSRGEISFFIGDKKQWGCGVATEAILLVRDYGIKNIGLKKITAGCYANNYGSTRALEKCGFKREASLKNEWSIDGERVDGIRFAYLLVNNREQ